MKIFKKLFFVSIMLLVCGCGFLDWALGVDEKGNDKDGIPPIDMFMEVVKQMGPIGTLISGALTIGGGVYVGHKRGKAKNEGKLELAERGLKAVVHGVEKIKDDMSEDDKNDMNDLLKKKIPNEWHPVINKIRDTL